MSPFRLSSHSTLINGHQHDGEKDTRGPQDFSGNNSSKLDDGGDGDGDDDDDDDDIPSRKRRHDGKLKPPADMVPPSVRRSPFPVIFLSDLHLVDGLRLS